MSCGGDMSADIRRNGKFLLGTSENKKQAVNGDKGSNILWSYDQKLRGFFSPKILFLLEYSG